MKIGEFNLLAAKRRTLNGYYLVDNKDVEVLLPNKYVPAGMKPDDEISVFIFKDSEDRLTATTIEPKILLNEFAFLKVVDVNPVGAFLDWGLEKDLLVPYSEQSEKMKVGSSYPVYLYLDEKTQRLAASGKINKFLEKDEITVEKDQEVELLICNSTDLGINVIINDVHNGLLYDNELFQAVIPGERVIGYVKNIRPDNKIDVSLQKQGYINVEPNAKKIL
ncbi:MAG: GntR family transcriptional regulator, partial [Bacteroidales bacterium]|nr:GntR family transcriptional regulator [Bacteroidales bacterium]